MLLIQRVCEGSQDLNSWFCTNPPSQGWDTLPKPPQCPGTAVTHVVGFPWVGSSPGLGTQMCPLGTRPRPQRTFGSIMGDSTPSGSASPWHNRHPESGTTRSTWWHLCDPEGPWQGEKPTEDRQFLREGWFGVLPLHFLAQERKARCWHSLFPHLPTSKISETLSSEFPKGKGENQNQHTEEQLELHLVLKRIDKSPPHQ